MFKVGDIVTIRQYDDMVKEYGLNLKGRLIVNGLPFSQGMKAACGCSLAVKYAFSTDRYGMIYQFSDGLLDLSCVANKNGLYMFNEDMIEPPIPLVSLEMSDDMLF